MIVNPEIEIFNFRANPEIERVLEGFFLVFKKEKMTFRALVITVVYEYRRSYSLGCS